MLLLVGVLESALEPTASNRINDETAFIVLCVMTYSVDTVLTNKEVYAVCMQLMMM